MADNSNPGNFANRPKEEVQAAAQKGGQTSTTGGFASMDPDKQVRSRYRMLTRLISTFNSYNGHRETLRPKEDRPAAAHSNLEVRRRRKLAAKAVNRPRR